jgi:Ala-tRNA(Pro) deacylase
MPAARIKDYLDTHNVPYKVIPHRQVFTTQEVAQVTHIPGQEVAKSVLFMIDGELTMVVVPASDRVSLDLLREETGARRIELAGERDFRDKFPGCEVGAMPPFGNLYGLKVLVADALTRDEQIAFNAGTHTEVLQIRYSDFERLVHPRVVAVTPIH